MHTAKKYCLGSGVAPQTPVPLHAAGQKRCFWIPGMVVFELHNAKKYCLGDGVALQTPIPLYPIGQQRCFWVPRMVVFEMDDTKKNVWVLGGRPKHPYLCTLQASKGVFGCLGWGCLKCTMP